MTIPAVGTRTLLLLTFAACGDKESATGMAASTDESGSGGSDTTTPTGTAEAGSTGALDCHHPSTPVGGQKVTVTLRNAGPKAIFVGTRRDCDDGFSISRFLELLGPDDTQLQPELGVCEYSCAELIAGLCGCGDGCDERVPVQLDPGGSIKLVWSGGYSVATDLVRACFGDCGEFAGDGCMARIQALPATYQFVARARPELTCGDPCTCVANPEGWCELDNGQVAGGPELVAKTSFNYPGTTSVEVTFP